MITDYEWPLWQTAGLVCGIDEAGRGPLAGPVVAAAVDFPALVPTGWQCAGESE